MASGSQLVPPPPQGFQIIEQAPQAASGAIPPPPPGFQMVGPSGPQLSPLGDDVSGMIDAIFPSEPMAVEQGPGLMQRAATGAVGLAGDFGSGMARGMSMLAGAPVDLINASPKLLNLLPGEQGMTPITDHPRGGSADMEALFNLPAESVNAVAGTDLDVFHEPDSMAGRVVNRVGQEMGAAAPIVGVGAKLASGARALDEMSGVERFLAAPMRKAPGEAIRREAAYAAASGTGAQTSNELFTLNGEGTPVTDVGGSVAGVASLAAGGGLAGLLRNLLAGATNSPQFMDDLAGQAVVDQIIDSSGAMRAQAEPFALRGKQPQLDTRPLAKMLRTPAEVERLIPGYTADIGARSGDPLLQTFAQDANARVSGAGNAARTRNTGAVNEAVGALAPQGDPAQFRQALQGGVDAEIAGLFDEELAAKAAADEARGAVAPQMAGPTARGTEIRAGAQGAYDSALDEVSELYRAIDESDAHIDPAALAERFGTVDAGLPVNDKLRFRPQEADTPGRLGEEGPVPLREATAIRSGLSNDVMAARAKGEPRQASIAGQYRDELDRYLAEELDPEASAAYAGANRARFDVGQRFEEGNTGIAQALRRTERGGYVLDASALPRKFVQPDTGKISDYQGLMREAGDQPGVRDAIADQVLEDAQPFLDNPERLRTFLGERNVVLNDFPEVRQRLENAGVKVEGLSGATARRETGERDLTTPGRSPEADYLNKSKGQAFGNDENRRSVSRIVNAADPRAATKQLLSRAGGTPEAAVNLRSAFWEELRGRGMNSATDMAGQENWNARKVLDSLNDPKFAAVAEELWRDNPEDLKSIKDMFTALEAASPGKARAPGSSGTAQSLQGKLDKSMSATGLASRARSVSRGQLSPVIAGIDILSTWMRNKGKQVQARAIDSLTAQVVNNPGLAADLLEQFNPADYAARRQMLTQKYGARIGNVLEMLDAANPGDEDSELKGAVSGGD
jgi:hypothetical protein